MHRRQPGPFAVVPALWKEVLPTETVNADLRHSPLPDLHLAAVFGDTVVFASARGHTYDRGLLDFILTSWVLEDRCERSSVNA